LRGGLAPLPSLNRHPLPKSVKVQSGTQAGCFGRGLAPSRHQYTLSKGPVKCRGRGRLFGVRVSTPPLTKTHTHTPTQSLAHGQAVLAQG
jgi:hypothetical protein